MELDRTVGESRQGEKREESGMEQDRTVGKSRQGEKT